MKRPATIRRDDATLRRAYDGTAASTSRLLPALCVAVACLGPALAGCAPYRAQPLAAETEAARFSARRLDDADLLAYVASALHEPSGATESERWNLDRLTLAALYFHPDMLLARARLATAKAAIRTASQIPNPSLTILGGPQPQFIGYSLTLLFETFGKRGLRISQADALARAARWRVVDAAWQIRAGVRAALLGIWAAQRRLALGQRGVDVQRRLVGMQEQMLAAGAASATDLARERVTLARLDLATGDFASQYSESRAALAAAIGVPVEALADASLDLSTFETPPAIDAGNVAALRRTALAGRADARSLLAEYEASETALRGEIARQYPDLSLSPAYNYDFRNRFEINPTVALPIFNHNQGPVAEAEARRQEAAARFLALQNRIAGQIEQAAAAYQAATATLSQADRLVAQERSRLRQSARAFSAGAIDRPTLVLAQAEAASIDASRLDAAVARLQAAGSIEDGLQRTVFDPGFDPGFDLPKQTDDAPR